MEKPSFEILEHAGVVELRASAALTVSNENDFRQHLLKLLQHGKSKSFKLNLKEASAIDACGLHLIYILKRQLNAVNASLVIEMPDRFKKSSALNS